MIDRIVVLGVAVDSPHIDLFQEIGNAECPLPNAVPDIILHMECLIP